MTTSLMSALEPTTPAQQALQGLRGSAPPPAMARPLVSVVAIAYNNAAVVLETLESIRRQDYEAIELIVSDDGSKDGTPAVVERWLQQHGARFQGARLLTSAANEGICRNLAKGMAVARGAWIKAIACDDLLCDDAITKYLEQTQRDGTELAFSQITKVCAQSSGLVAQGNLLTDEKAIALLEQPVALLRTIRKENFLPAPGAFYSRRLFDLAGGVDTRFKHLDDWPLWLRMLPLAAKVSWIDKPLVLYRISTASISQAQRSHPVSKLLFQDRQRLYQQLQRDHLSGLQRWHQQLQLLRNRLTLEKFGNTWLAHRLLMPLQLLSPLTWLQALARVGQRLGTLARNAGPLARGAWYFGPAGLRQRVRVFGPIQMRIARRRVILGRQVTIHAGVTLGGKQHMADTITIGSHATIEQNAYLHAHGGRLVLGEHVHVGVGAVLQGYGHLVIGEHTMLGPYTQVYTSNHRTTRPALPRHLLGEKPRAVTIGRNCWIGASSIVLPGVQLADESVVPAGTVLRRGATAAGAP